MPFLGQKSNFLGAPINFFGTIMTGHQKYTFFVLTTMHSQHQGRRQGQILAQITQNDSFRGKKCHFGAIKPFFEGTIQIFWYHHHWTPERQLFHVDNVAQSASGWAPGPDFGTNYQKWPIFGSKMLFLGLNPFFGITNHFFGTIMTGPQKSTFFVLSTLHKRRLGRRQGPFLLKKSSFFYATPI